MKTKLPAYLSIGQLLDFTIELTGSFQGFPVMPDVFLEAKLPKRHFVQAIKEIIGFEEELVLLFEGEVPGLSEALGKLEDFDRQEARIWAKGFSPDTQKELQALYAEKKRVEQEIEALRDFDKLVEDKLVASLGETIPELGIDTIVWQQEKEATIKKFGVSTLFILPANGDGRIPIGHDLEWEKQRPDQPEVIRPTIETSLAFNKNESLTAFYTRVAALVGKPQATNGVANTAIYKGQVEVADVQK